MSNSIIQFTKSAIFATSAMAVLAAAQPASAAKLAGLSVGNWSGGAYTSNRSGKFSHCALSAKYKNGMSLLLSVTANKRWSIGFARNSWNLEVGTSQAVRFRIDDGPSYSGRAEARTRHLTQVMLPKSSRLFDQFRYGNRFFIKTRNGETSFNLTDADRVLNTLVQCARKHRIAQADPFGSQGQSSNDPFASKVNFNSEPVRRREPTPQTRVEALTAASIMLSKYGIKPNYITPASQPRLFKKYDVSWTMSGMIGTLRIIPQDQVAPGDLRTQIIRTDKKQCAGKYISHIFTPSHANHTDFFSACGDVKNAAQRTGLAVYYVVMPRREGGNYLMSIIGKVSNHKQVRQTGMRLKEIAVALNAKGSVPGARPVSY
ncbi:MAG: hypothetical protein AAF468_16605 [Pseudomonadota bacterium]